MTFIDTPITGSTGIILPSPPVLRGRGVGGEGESLGLRRPLTPNPSPLSTGARGTGFAGCRMTECQEGDVQ
jgi:hypothetical protein